MAAGVLIYLLAGAGVLQSLTYSDNMHFLEVIGILSLIYFGWKILLQSLKCVYKYLIRGPRRRNAVGKERGRWALITGATDGIGKAYALALAKKGLNIVLVSRDLQKLQRCASEIEAQHSVQTKTVQADFAGGVEIYSDIEKAIAGLEVGVLVNNVGVSYSYPELFLDLPDREKFIDTIIKTNVVSVTKMCELVMPGMAARKSGVVVNVSSAAALFPSPLLTLYVATKSFVEKFSDELRNEYDKKGIVIQTLLPGYVATKLAKIRNSTWLAPSADKYVASAMGKIGIDDHTTGYYAHTIMVGVIKAIENICPQFAVYVITKNMKTMRQRALKSQMKRTQPSASAET